ncbi:MAG: phosphatidylglycerophosphate synthase, partial [Gammaproteobacteria bacterium]
MKWNIPNTLTWMRIAMIPVLVLFYYLPGQLNREEVITVLFVVAALTDWLDGYLA